MVKVVITVVFGVYLFISYKPSPYELSDDEWILYGMCRSNLRIFVRESVIILETNLSIQNINELKVAMAETFPENSFSGFELCGASNVFFNPDFNLWKSNAVVLERDNSNIGKEVAISAKIKKSYWLNVTFNGTEMESTNSLVPVLPAKEH